MVKYGESYITSQITTSINAKYKANPTYDIVSSSRFRAFGYINANFVINDATDLFTTASTSIAGTQFRAARLAQANLSSIVTFSVTTSAATLATANISSANTFNIKEFYAQIWNFRKMNTNYIEGHTIRYELTDGYVYNTTSQCYSKPKVLLTYKVPYLGYAENSSNFTQSSSAQRLRNGVGNLETSATSLIIGVLNPGSLSSMLFPIANMTTLAKFIANVYPNLLSFSNISAETKLNRKITVNVDTITNLGADSKSTRKVSSSLSTNASMSVTGVRSIGPITGNLITEFTPSFAGDYGHFTIRVTTTTNSLNVYMDVVQLGGFFVDWGDGSTSITNSHAYTSAGVYTIIVKYISEFKGLQTGGNSQGQTYSVVSWGSIGTRGGSSPSKFAASYVGLENPFPILNNLVGVPPTLGPNITKISLAGSQNFNDSNIITWDMSKLATGNNAPFMFARCSSFNQNIGSWDVSKITNFSYWFLSASAFNQNIASWNTSNATDMTRMFESASAFNQPISRSGNSWNTGSVTNMTSMFASASSFDQNISNWCVSLIASKPSGFDTSTSANWTTAEKPVWGTCP